MAWNVEHTDEFAEWYGNLSEPQQDDVTAVVLLLMEQASFALSLFVGDRLVKTLAHARAACAKRGASNSRIRQIPP